MLKLALKRLLALIGAIVFGGWSAFLALLDWIGRAQVIKDAPALAADNLPLWAQWLFTTPWWVPSIATGVLTALLVWLAWPRHGSSASAAPASAEHPEKDAVARAEYDAPRAVLRLRFSGRMEPPDEVFKDNINSSFAYWSPGGRAEDPVSGNVLFEIPSSWAVFVTFERPVAYRQIVANFTGARPAAWQVRQTLPTVAVVTVEGGMPECELEIITRS